MRILIDGEERALLPANDRGLQFGDGVFETLRLCHGEPQLWPLHWARMRRGLERLAIPAAAEAVYLGDFATWSGYPEVLVKLIVTRGPSQRGYAMPQHPRPSRIVLEGAIAAAPRPAPNALPALRVGVCQTRIAQSPVPGCKHLNRLENILARQEWQPDWDEGLMRSVHGDLISGTQGNLYILESAQLVTPPVDTFGIAGTRRTWLLQQALAAGLKVRQEPVTLARAANAQAWFLSNTRIGLRRADWEGREASGAHAAHAAHRDHSVLETWLEIGERLHALG